MTRIKLCGLSRTCDIEAANDLMPEYIGFVFAPESRRRVSADTAGELKRLLNPSIEAVGVFAGEAPERIAALLKDGIIDLAQLHGGEDEEYIKGLRSMTDWPIIKAFRIEKEQDLILAEESAADLVLLDSGSGGEGKSFDWSLLREVKRPYFLAGGLNSENVENAVKEFAPFAVDVSSGIETNGWKDRYKMNAFVQAVRG